MDRKTADILNESFSALDSLMEMQQDDTVDITQCIDGEILTEYLKVRELEEKRIKKIKKEVHELSELLQLLELQTLI